MTKETNGRFGTFGGVFTPCTLTILGVIMFLRLGQVVGQSGVLIAVGIIIVSKVISTLTALSLSAIATNTKVKGGGAYFLISRSLGVEFGGAIGVVFYLAQAISVAMYVIGFTEAFVGTVPAAAPHFVAVATAVNVVTFLCVYIGAGWTIKVQFFILLTLAASVLSFFAGGIIAFDSAALTANWSGGFDSGQDAFTMFALFFPAVTGIMAGANMSGDLRQPARSIPRGTLLSIGVTTIVYIAMTVLLGASADRIALKKDTLIVRGVSLWPVLITAGVFAATISSALGSMMGAPRILQAFARDEIFKRLKFFAAGSGASGEPRRATLLTFLIAQVCILAGDLNAIAPIITMFFMITYGLLNLATFYEAVTKNPSYRPTFKFCHWSISLLGAVACLAVMFLLNWVWATGSIVVMAGLCGYIRYREIEGRWGDLQSGVVFERTRRNLLKLEQADYHPKNWRPTILALSGSGWTRPHLAVYGYWLTSGHGILSLAHVIVGSLEEHAERRERFENTLRTFIAKEELQAFPAVIIASSLSAGIESLAQCHGIGGLRPNTVLLGWPDSSETADVFGANLRLISQMDRSAIIARFPQRSAETDSREFDGDPWDCPTGSIDVWWRGMDNGALMLLLAHLLHQNPEWRRNPIRVLRVVGNSEAEDQVRDHILQLAAASRIHAEPVVVVSDDAAAEIQSHSTEAAVVILGLDPPRMGNEIEFYERMESFAGALSRVLFVKSAGHVELES